MRYVRIGTIGYRDDEGNFTHSEPIFVERADEKNESLSTKNSREGNVQENPTENEGSLPYDELAELFYEKMKRAMKHRTKKEI